MKRLAIVTGGGDAPGLNAAIRSIVLAGLDAGVECFGVRDGFDGLLTTGGLHRLTRDDVADIHMLGGTILGTTNLGNPIALNPSSRAAESYATRCLNTVRDLKIDAVLAIGGDGTLTLAHQLSIVGVPIVGIPKTIDRDVVLTDGTIGFDTAASCATAALDRLRTTAEAHHRIMVIEVMGRYAGWIALYAGLAGGADVILLPEIPFRFERLAGQVRACDRRGARATIVIAAEGAYPLGSRPVVASPAEGGRQERLGGIAAEVARELQRVTCKEARYDVLGHLQRGGPPSMADRVLAARFGSVAFSLATGGHHGLMVALRSSDVGAVRLDRVAGKTRPVPLDHSLVTVARRMGVVFGDESSDDRHAARH